MELNIFAYEETSVIDVLVGFVSFILKAVFTGIFSIKDVVLQVLENSLHIPSPPFQETLGVGIMEEVGTKEAIS